MKIERDREHEACHATKAKVSDQAEQIATLEVAFFTLQERLGNALNYSNQIDIAYNELANK